MLPKLRKQCSCRWKGWQGTMLRWLMRMAIFNVTRILDGLDSLYGVSMTFQLLNAALCGLQQKPFEPTRTYYNCMAQIVAILWECHGNQYRLGELARMSKDCFYVGLLPENCPMVVHLKDQPIPPLWTYSRHCWSSPKMMPWHILIIPSQHLQNRKPHQSTVEHYHWQPQADKRNDGHMVHPTQLNTELVEEVPEATAIFPLSSMMGTSWRPGTMTGSDWPQNRPLRSVNTTMASVSIARRKVTVGINARSPSPESFRSWRTSRTKNARSDREGLKPSRGHRNEGRPCPYTVSRSQPGGASGDWGSSPVDSPSTGDSPYKYWNEDALSQWLGPENLGWAFLDGVRTRCLLITVLELTQLHRPTFTSTTWECTLFLTWTTPWIHKETALNW